jgi:diguanylate cyclase
VFATFALLSFSLPAPVALAIVALVGYLAGLRCGTLPDALAATSQAELRRALAVARALDRISLRLRCSLARHHGNLVKFKQQVNQLSQWQEEAAWRDFCRQTEEMLGPTLDLAAQLTAAYDEIRHQTSSLMSFSEVQTDPLTRIRNRRGLDEAIDWQLTLKDRYQLGFSVVLFDIDYFKRVNDRQGHLEGDRLLQRLAGLLANHARGSDIVSRYGGEEFLIVMPHADLEGAATMAQRVQISVSQELPITVSGGVASALDGDTRDSLVARADAALFQAKAAGRNCIFCHTGTSIEPIPEAGPCLAAN